MPLLTTLLIHPCSIRVKAKAFTIAYKVIHDPLLALIPDLLSDFSLSSPDIPASLLALLCYLPALVGSGNSLGALGSDAENTEGLLTTQDGERSLNPTGREH